MAEERDLGGLVYEYDPDYARQQREEAERWERALQPGTRVYLGNGVFGVLGERVPSDGGTQTFRFPTAEHPDAVLDIADPAPVSRRTETTEG